MTIKEFKIQYALGLFSYDMKIELTTNPKTFKEILAALSTDISWFVRCGVARNPNTPKKVLTILSTDNE